MAVMTSREWIDLLHWTSSVTLMKVHSVLLSRSRSLMKILNSIEPDITCNQLPVRLWTIDLCIWRCSHLLSSLIQSIPRQFGYNDAVGDHVKSLLLHAHRTSYFIVHSSQVYQPKYSLCKSATTVPSHLFCLLCAWKWQLGGLGPLQIRNIPVLQCAPRQFQYQKLKLQQQLGQRLRKVCLDIQRKNYPSCKFGLW